MRIELVRRPNRSRAMAVLSPLVAIFLTVVAGFLVFSAVGVDPFRALYIYFIEPLTAWWSVEALIVKAVPIVIIAVGLSLCFYSNTWNIGAEGQLVAGAMAGSALPILFPDFQGPLVMPLMLILGIAGGMAYGAIPALLKTRFGANEILTSLMLVYVAQLMVDWLARGPWRNPAGHNFPDSRPFDGDQILPVVFGDSVRLNAVFAIVIAVIAWFVLRRTITGFQITVLGQAPRAGAFAGFSHKKMVVLAFLISGGLAGLAGICEVAGPTGMLRTSVSPGYGFTAIIVAFLGRLNPIGIIFAGLLLALSYMGGEGVQIELGMSDQITRVFQGMLLFFVLACDTFIFYRVRLVRTPAAGARAEGA
ncbi:simple sugar transport system permease protein [Rhodobium orientis]|uniref:Sugar ABC transporter permease n=1 Tax=Rhodobium orientis TaxID=34017 RepID=A0A327JRR8_9HYPH|nr:ABC transporter permease [Rhodobium orientis]MBB4302271.1 simple sugar transport system permease protein [Rhodobium orientis]MBK5948981.1 sugar ABC transporter permease [Rhodobium orientis]RAI28977.1 sugar ABC transporter permease [Rhodobium orientis]